MVNNKKSNIKRVNMINSQFVVKQSVSEAELCFSFGSVGSLLCSCDVWGLLWLCVMITIIIMMTIMSIILMILMIIVMTNHFFAHVMSQDYYVMMFMSISLHYIMWWFWCFLWWLLWWQINSLLMWYLFNMRIVTSGDFDLSSLLKRIQNTGTKR